MVVQFVLTALVAMGFTLTLAVACCAFEQETAWTPQLAQQVKRIGGVRASPDGTRVAYLVTAAVTKTNKVRWRSRLFVGALDGSRTVQLTRGDEFITAVRWSPDSDSLAFLSTRSGSPNIWRIPVDGGEAEQLTGEGNVRAFAWSPDGKQIALVMPERKESEGRKDDGERQPTVKELDENPPRDQLYAFSVSAEADGPRTLRELTQSDSSVRADGFDWSPDGTSIAFAHQPTARLNDWTKSEISVVDVASGKRRKLVEGGAATWQPLWSPDGRWIAYLASDDPPSWGFTLRVHVVAAESGTSRPLAETFDRLPTIVGWSADGQSVLISEIQRTVTRLAALPVDGGSPVDISPADVMVDEPHVNRTGSHIGFVSQALDRPPEAFVSPLDRFAPVQLSHVQRMPKATLGQTKLVQFHAQDGKTIEGLLSYPPDYVAGTRLPMLVLVHGGPVDVFTQHFIAGPCTCCTPYCVAVFTSAGFAVLRCNVRGSRGYGRELRYGNYRDWGGGDCQDLMAAVDQLTSQGIADPERLGILGWSYGGFLTASAITQSKQFKAASVGGAVVNLISFAGTTDVPDFVTDYFGGDFWDNSELWRSHSPLFQVQQIATPTLIQHGDEDRRVPVSQSHELYRALKKRCIATQMVTYPGQGHMLDDPAALWDAQQRNLEWFTRWLKKPAP